MRLKRKWASRACDDPRILCVAANNALNDFLPALIKSSILRLSNFYYYEAFKSSKVFRGTTALSDYCLRWSYYCAFDSALYCFDFRRVFE